MNDTVPKIGILGGTFNPIHNGHLMIARCAADQFSLDTVLFMPTGHTAYKEYAGEDMTRHRCRMVELAIRDEPGYAISLAETGNERISYTYLTLERLREDFPDSRFFFLLGGDSLRDFPMWKHPEEICKQAVILVAARDSVDGKEMDMQIAQMSERFHGIFYRLDTPRIDISSSEIRQRIAADLDIRSMVPPAVADYIKANGLYRDNV